MSDNKAVMTIFHAHTKGLIENLPYEHIKGADSEKQGYINGFRAGVAVFQSVLESEAEKNGT